MDIGRAPAVPFSRSPWSWPIEALIATLLYLSGFCYFLHIRNSRLILCRSPDKAGNSTFSRVNEQTKGDKTRTVGTYQVFHDGQAAAAIAVGGVQVPLSGTTAESGGQARTTRPLLRRTPAESCQAAIP